MFRVRWARRALDELARFWAQADSPLRNAITSASHTLEQRLKTDPFSEGESRSRRRRITFVAPLVVTFRIEADEQTVSVLEIGLSHWGGQ